MGIARNLAVRYVRTKFRILSSLSKTRAAERAFALFCTPQYRNKKNLPPIFEKAEKLEFDFEGNTIRGYRWNHPAPRKALILHGFESSVVNFDRYVKPLVEKGYEVLAFDAPAHGRSSGKRINVLTYKQMIRYVIDHYGPVHSFIAHSFGGLSLCLALEEIPHNEDFRMVLIAPAAETKTAVDHFFQFLHLDDEVRREFDKLIAEVGGKPTEWYSVTRAAKQIKARVLFLQDKDDEMTPYADILPLMEKNYSNFRFMITEGLGHRRIYREQKLVKEIVDFL